MIGHHWTWQTLIDGRMTLTAFCHSTACAHSQKLNLEKLRDKYGPDAPAMEWDIRPKLKCAKCGGTDVGLTYFGSRWSVTIPASTTFSAGS
jgi:hypothetical protein